LQGFITWFQLAKRPGPITRAAEIKEQQLCIFCVGEDLNDHEFSGWTFLVLMSTKINLKEKVRQKNAIEVYLDSMRRRRVNT
jgi:hypothetical protein